MLGFEWNDSNKAKLAMWVKRGKLIEVDGKIDDTNLINRDWILKQKDSANQEDRPQTQVQREPDRSYDEVPEGSAYGIEKKLKAQQLEKLKVDTRIAELKEEKIRGEVIPVELIKNLFSTHTQSIITSQKDGIEELLISISSEARLTGDQLAKLRGKMITTLNRAVDKAITITEKNMKAMVDEFSIKREVGEHD